MVSYLCALQDEQKSPTAAWCLRIFNSYFCYLEFNGGLNAFTQKMCVLELHLDVVCVIHGCTCT